MANHPNRGKRTAASTPTPDEIRDWRRARELSAAAAGALVYTSGRAWQLWEAGERRMHPATWELARIKGDSDAAATIARIIRRVSELNAAELNAAGATCK